MCMSLSVTKVVSERDNPPLSNVGGEDASPTACDPFSLAAGTFKVSFEGGLGRPPLAVVREVSSGSN